MAGVGGPLTLAEMGLRLRADLYRAMVPHAVTWMAAPPISVPGHPAFMAPEDTAHLSSWRGGGFCSWRIYTRRQPNPRQPFLLRAVIAEAPPFERAVDDCYRVLINRPADAAGLAEYVGLLQSGGSTIEKMLHAIRASPEAGLWDEEIRFFRVPSA